MLGTHSKTQPPPPSNCGNSVASETKTEPVIAVFTNVTARRLPVFLLQLVSLPSKYQRWYVPCKFFEFPTQIVHHRAPRGRQQCWAPRCHVR